MTGAGDAGAGAGTGSGPSRRPYLLRAMHEWMGDAGFTPHVIVDAGRAGV
jgi:stringent starvation protein B